MKLLPLIRGIPYTNKSNNLHKIPYLYNKLTRQGETRQWTTT